MGRATLFTIFSNIRLGSGTVGDYNDNRSKISCRGSEGTSNAWCRSYSGKSSVNSTSDCSVCVVKKFTNRGSGRLMYRYLCEYYTLYHFITAYPFKNLPITYHNGGTSIAIEGTQSALQRLNQVDQHST